MNKNPIRMLRLFYAAAFLPALIFFIFFSGIDWWGNSSTSLYIINLSCIILTLSACYCTTTFEQWACYQRFLNRDTTTTNARKQINTAIIKIALFEILLSINSFFYCTALYAQSPKYCALISLVVGIFAFPKSRNHHQNP